MIGDQIIPLSTEVTNLGVSLDSFMQIVCSCETHCTHMQFPFKESVAYSSIHRHEDLSPCCIGTYNFKTRLLQWFIYCFVSQGQEKAGVHSKSCSTFSFFLLDADHMPCPSSLSFIGYPSHIALTLKFV